MKNFFKNLRNKNDQMWKAFHDPKTQITRQARWYVIAPLIIIVVGALLLCIPSVGFNLGLDFTGGSIVKITGLSEEIRGDVKNDVSKIMNEKRLKYSIMDETNSTTREISFSVKYEIPRGASDEDMKDIFNTIKALELDYATPGITVNDAQTTTASASGDRILMTFISVAVSLIAILIYMLFRFKLTSGICAVVGLIHDVLVMVALTAIFQIEVNYPFVAALITVVVYSLNNTLVLFDRIREKERRDVEKRIPTVNLVDAAIKETFGRTMGTTITTLVAVLALAIIGVPLIRQFALPIFFGLVAGTFSTIFVTTSLYVRFENAKRLKKKMKATSYRRQDNLVASD